MPLSILVFNMELKFIVVLRKHTKISHSYLEIKRNAYDVRTMGQLVTPQTRKQFGDRAVKVKGRLLWNRIN